MAEKLPIEATRGVAHINVRLDVRRDTRLFVTHNVNKHLHVTVGGDAATIILHPHAARRLIADLQAVLNGAEFAHD
jgi:hypothetical protein